MAIAFNCWLTFWGPVLASVHSEALSFTTIRGSNQDTPKYMDMDIVWNGKWAHLFPLQILSYCLTEFIFDCTREICHIVPPLVERRMTRYGDMVSWTNLAFLEPLEGPGRLCRYFSWWECELGSLTTFTLPKKCKNSNIWVQLELSSHHTVVAFAQILTFYAFLWIYKISAWTLEIWRSEGKSVENI